MTSKEHDERIEQIFNGIDVNTLPPGMADRIAAQFTEKSASAKNEKKNEDLEDVMMMIETQEDREIITAHCDEIVKQKTKVFEKFRKTVQEERKRKLIEKYDVLIENSVKKRMQIIINEQYSDIAEMVQVSSTVNENFDAKGRGHVNDNFKPTQPVSTKHYGTSDNNFQIHRRGGIDKTRRNNQYVYIHIYFF